MLNLTAAIPIHLPLERTNTHARARASIGTISDVGFTLQKFRRDLRGRSQVSLKAKESLALSRILERIEVLVGNLAEGNSGEAHTSNPSDEIRPCTRRVITRNAARHGSVCHKYDAIISPNGTRRATDVLRAEYKVLFRRNFPDGLPPRVTRATNDWTLRARSRDHTQLPVAAKEILYLSSLLRRSYSLPLVYPAPLCLALRHLGKPLFFRAREEARAILSRLVSSRLVFVFSRFVLSGSVTSYISRIHIELKLRKGMKFPAGGSRACKYRCAFVIRVRTCGIAGLSAFVFARRLDLPRDDPRTYGGINDSSQPCV